MQRLPTNTLITQDYAHNKLAQNAHSKNVLIKGDNLEVLKHLKNAYYRKIKMIYIDPPYNTGKDFVYNDERDFTPQSLANMASISEEEAENILSKTLNKASSHSAWLAMRCSGVAFNLQCFVICLCAVLRCKVSHFHALSLKMICF